MQSKHIYQHQHAFSKLSLSLPCTTLNWMELYLSFCYQAVKRALHAENTTSSTVFWAPEKVKARSHQSAWGHEQYCCIQEKWGSWLSRSIGTAWVACAHFARAVQNCQVVCSAKAASQTRSSCSNRRAYTIGKSVVFPLSRSPFNLSQQTFEATEVPPDWAIYRSQQDEGTNL